MACNSKKCRERRAAANSARGAVSATVVNAQDFTKRSPKAPRIRGSNGQFYALSTELTRLKPSNGWDLSVEVQGHTHTITASRPAEIVSQIVEVYHINGIEISELDVWYNCNIIWLGRVSAKHAWTTVEDLISFSKQNSVFTRELKREDPSPETWGGSAWRFLGAFIAQSSRIDVTVFWEIITTLHGMLNDDFIGCEECAEHFKTRIKELPERPTNYRAARWMFETMNLIREQQGRPQITWEQAVATHRWENLKDG